MANTNKTTAPKTKQTLEPSKKDTDIKLKSLEQQLAEAMKLITRLSEQTNVIKTKETTEKIDSDELIPVISQCVGELTLTTEGNGSGTPYIFSEFGDIQDIPFGDLRDVVKNNKSFTTNGYFYIAHDEAVKQLRLTTLYKKLLKNEDMIHLFEKDANTIIELYKLAPDSQKQIVIDLVTDKKINGIAVDANVLMTLGQLSGKDLINIEK